MRKQELKRESIRNKRRIISILNNMAYCGRGGDSYATVMNGTTDDPITRAMERAIRRGTSFTDRKGRDEG